MNQVYVDKLHHISMRQQTMINYITNYVDEAAAGAVLSLALLLGAGLMSSLRDSNGDGRQ